MPIPCRQTFSANPFRRMLTHAVYEGIITASDKPTTENIRALRSYVQSRGWKRKGKANELYSVSEEVHTAGVNITVVGRVSSLEEDLHHIVTSALGYQLSPDVDLTYHCISSCATVAANVSIAGLARNIRDKSGAKKTPSENLRGNATSTKPLNIPHFTGWYDDSAAAVIQREFGADFAAFGYPTDSRRMYDEEERRPPQVFFRSQKRIQALLTNYTHILPSKPGIPTQVPTQARCCTVLLRRRKSTHARAFRPEQCGVRIRGFWA